jgi:hypothetical protein
MMKNEPITRGADTPAKKKAVFRPLMMIRQHPPEAASLNPFQS